LSVWCGLVAGLLEVGTIVLRKTFFDANHLYGISRHFVWLIPVANLGIVLALGLLGWVASLASPRRVGWLVKRGLCAIVPLPAVLIAFPRIYTLAWLAVTLGIAARLVPVFESSARRFRWAVQVGLLLAVGILLCLGGSIWVNDRIKRSRESARPMPEPGSPNVLLIVLDTVAAGHLNLYGYERPTSPTLVELAERGIRFDSARAASSWTLPSHATIFTGRWMHELSVGWLNPLDGRFRRQHDVLRERHGARPRIRSLRRLYLPGIHSAQVGDPGPSSAGTLRKNLADRGGTTVACLDAPVRAEGLAVAGLRSQGSGGRQPRVA
jgi:hypothetical protein